MNCRAVERWLDRGMPENAREVAMRHVAVCGACFEAFEAATSLETALRAAAADTRALPAGSAASVAPDFVSNVMARVAAADSLARVARPDRGRANIWVELVTDPLSVIAITAAFVVALWSAWHPNWFYEVGMNLAGRWWSVAALPPRSPIELDPFVWAGLAVAASPFVVWGSWALYRRIERALLLLAARPTS